MAGRVMAGRVMAGLAVVGRAVAGLAVVGLAVVGRAVVGLARASALRGWRSGSFAGRRRVAVALTLTGASIALLAGCSQVAAIAPVGGSHLAAVRYAAIDVLTNGDVAILTAPVCSQASDESVTCQGATLNGASIHVAASAAAQDRITVTVGTKTVYDGSVQAVLEKAVQK